MSVLAKLLISILCHNDMLSYPKQYTTVRLFPWLHCFNVTRYIAVHTQFCSCAKYLYIYIYLCFRNFTFTVHTWTCSENVKIVLSSPDTNALRTCIHNRTCFLIHSIQIHLDGAFRKYNNAWQVWIPMIKS